MPQTVLDAALSVSKALPNGANSVTSDSLQVMSGAKHKDFAVDCELEIVAPALTTAQLPDTKKITYDIVQGDTANLGDATVLYGAVLVQLGADGAGAAGKSVRVRLPSGVKKFIGIKATNDGAGNASTVSLVGRLVF